MNDTNSSEKQNTILYLSTIENASKCVRSVACKVCEATSSFTRDADLINHFKGHEMNLEHVCILCGRDFIDERDLINHMLIHSDVLEEYHKIFLKRVETLRACAVTQLAGAEDVATKRPQEIFENNTNIKSEFETDCELKANQLEEERVEIKLELDSAKPEDDLDDCKTDICFVDALNLDTSSWSLPIGDVSPMSEVNDDSKNVPKAKTKLRRKIFKCIQCHFKTTKNTHLKKHSRIHDALFSCDKCNFISKQKTTLKFHKVSHMSGHLYECSKCDYKTTIKPNLKTHLAVHGQKSIVCYICRKGFKRKSNLRQHMSIHSDERNFNCDVCTMSYKSNVYLRKHKHTQHGIKPSAQKVLVCSNENTSHYECDVCGYLTSKKKYMSLHMEKHVEGWPFACDQCDYKTKVSRYLINHRAVHMEKHIYCEVCGKTFRRIKNLKEHLLSHSDERNYHCTKCPQSFKEKKTLTMHTLLKHTDKKDRPFKCSYCDHRSVSSLYRRMHERSHSPENAFRCEQCSYSCRTLTTLKNHSLIHMDFPTFACLSCDFKAITERAVKRHSGTHRKDAHQLTIMQSHHREGSEEAVWDPPE